MRALFFGCYDEPGHMFCGPGGRYQSRRDVERVCPWTAGEVDARLAPRSKPRYGGDRRGEELAQGVSALHHRDGWTALAMWDRTGDSRGNSNSTFLFDATLDFDQAVVAAREHFPQLFERFTFEVVPVTDADGGSDA